MADLLDLSLPDIVKAKIRRKEKEVLELKEQFKLLTGKEYTPPPPTTSTTPHIDFNAIKNGITPFTILANELRESLVKEKKDGFKYPSQSELREMILNFLKANRRLIKTSELVNYYFPDIDKINRPDLTRRFSVTLNLLRMDGKIFSKKVKGEKGDFYTVYEDLVKQETVS